MVDRAGAHGWFPEGCMVAGGGACMVDGGHAWLGGCMVKGEHAWLPGGMCGCQGGMHDCWGAYVVSWGGMHGFPGWCMVTGGACVVDRVMHG